MTFKSSPVFTPLSNEDSYLYSAAQLEKARLCLNALIAENAFGTTAYIASVVTKHYKNSFFRQLYKLIGSSDIVESSVGGLLVITFSCIVYVAFSICLRYAIGKSRHGGL